MWAQLFDRAGFLFDARARQTMKPAFSRFSTGSTQRPVTGPLHFPLGATAADPAMPDLYAASCG
jgi:hypothetical protein